MSGPNEGLRPGGGRPAVLHLSADFPDPIEPFKTPVIADLVAMTSDRFRNRVLSLNRAPPRPLRFAADVLLSAGRPTTRYETSPFEHGMALQYRAPAKGIFHAAMLRSLGRQLGELAEGQGARPDLIVAHKLTVEGFIASRMAQDLDRPYALTIQGDTDAKIIAARPDLRPALRQIFHAASQVVSFAPWSLDYVESKLGSRSGPSTVIPCPTDLDAIVAPRMDGREMLSVFHLKNYKRKNLRLMGQALQQVRETVPDARLCIVGGGSKSDLEAARKAVAGAAGITFEGPLDRAHMADRMNRAAGFVLPSKRESFGLVFIEALFAGLPVIHPDHQAISGFFPAESFAIPVPPDDVDALAAAMLRLLGSQVHLKRELEVWQKSAASQEFRRTSIARRYGDALDAALGGG